MLHKHYIICTEEYQWVRHRIYVSMYVPAEENVYPSAEEASEYLTGRNVSCLSSFISYASSAVVVNSSSSAREQSGSSEA